MKHSICVNGVFAPLYLILLRKTYSPVQGNIPSSSRHIRGCITIAVWESMWRKRSFTQSGGCPGKEHRPVLPWPAIPPNQAGPQPQLHQNFLFSSPWWRCLHELAEFYFQST